jgi:1-acyl-sn-glycerol-3-phosphate acyltransferase
MSSTELPPPLERNLHWRTSQWFMQIVSCFWLRYRAFGMERLPPRSGALLLINHQSHLDPLMVGLPLGRPISYLARDSLFKVPIVGWMLRNTYVIPLNREAASTSSLREAIRRVEHGFLVGIFPEGTRSEDGKIGTLKPGVLALIRRGKVPIYPVAVAGTFQAFPRGAWFLRPATVRVVFGEPLDAELIEQFGRNRDAEALAYIRDRLEDVQQVAEQWRRRGGSMQPSDQIAASPKALQSSEASRSADSP